MASGKATGEKIPQFPDGCLQALTEEWWVSDDGNDLRIGRLVRAVLSHTDQVPQMIVPEGRVDPTAHSKAKYKVEPFNIKAYRKHARLPVAGMPAFEGEVNLVHRAKARPAVVLGLGGTDIPKKDNPGAPRWQTAPTLLVAPYYGVAHSDKRGGWSGEFVERIKRMRYPQLFWDILPLPGGEDGSILRLDQLQAIGNHHNSLEITPYVLSEEALGVIEELLLAVRRGTLDPEGYLVLAKEILDEFYEQS